MTLVAISACQSQGKTTVLNSLAELGYNVIPQKTSRGILVDWGYTLNEVNSYKVLTRNFQEEMIKRHSAFIQQYVDSDEIYLQERSMADIFSYCLNIIGPFNEYSGWLNQYHARCQLIQQSYDGVIFLSGRENLVPEDDGVRSINPQFSNMIDMLIKYYVQDFDNGNVMYINTPYHDERVTQIATYLEHLASS
jgi:predicted ATPase